MARKRVVTKITETEIPSEPAAAILPPASEVLPPEDSELSAFETLLDGLDADAGVTIAIYRQPGFGNQSYEWLTELPAAGTSIGELYQLIQESYGQGRYRIMLRESGGLIRNRCITIGAPLKGARGAVVPDAAAPDLVKTITETMMRGFEMLAKQLQPPPAPPATNQLEVVATVFSMIERAKTLVTPAPAPVATEGARNVIKDMRELMSLRQEIEETSPMREGGSLGEIVLQLLRAVGPGVLQQLQQQAPAMPGGVPQTPGIVTPPLPPPGYQQPPAYSPAPALVQAPANQPTATAPGGPMPAEVQLLLDAARTDVDPSLFLDLAFQVLPDDEVQLQSILSNREHFYSLALAQVPELELLKPWFERLLDAVQLELTADPGEEETAGGEGSSPHAAFGASKVSALHARRNT